MARLILKPIVFFVALYVSGCVSAPNKLKNIEAPLSQIKAVIKKNLPLGLRGMSSNGRELYSNYFLVVKGKHIKAENLQYRKFASVSILGDRRPYTIKVEVFLEKRSKPQANGIVEYKDFRRDKRYSEYLLRKIHNDLENREETINFVDDFRVF